MYAWRSTTSCAATGCWATSKRSAAASHGERRRSGNMAVHPGDTGEGSRTALIVCVDARQCKSKQVEAQVRNSNHIDKKTQSRQKRVKYSYYLLSTLCLVVSVIITL